MRSHNDYVPRVRIYHAYLIPEGGERHMGCYSFNLHIHCLLLSVHGTKSVQWYNKSLDGFIDRNKHIPVVFIKFRRSSGQLITSFEYVPKTCKWCPTLVARLILPPITFSTFRLVHWHSSLLRTPILASGSNVTQAWIVTPPYAFPLVQCQSAWRDAFAYTLTNISDSECGKIRG